MIETLLALLIALTGIIRPVSPELTQLAQVRAVEIQSDFSHRYLAELNNGKWSKWGEVIGWNRGYSDPVTKIAEGWRDSPGHHAVLWDPSYPLIGCAVDIAGDTNYFVCIVGTPKAPAPPAVPGNTPQPNLPPLPDTAMAVE